MIKNGRIDRSASWCLRQSEARRKCRSGRCVAVVALERGARSGEQCAGAVIRVAILSKPEVACATDAQGAE